MFQALKIGSIFLLFASLSLAQRQLVLPTPSGEYEIAHGTAKLIDTSRTNPYFPTHGKRDVLISLFYPIKRSACSKTCTIDYMPPTTASYVDDYAVLNYGVPNGTMKNIKMAVCCKTKPKKHINTSKAYPVVLFQPGLTNSRLQYNHMAATLASSGYAVITMDHTFEALVVEYPDGNTTVGVPESYWNYDAFPNTEFMERIMDIRIADAQFVFQQLRRPDVVKSLIPDLKAGTEWDMKRVAIYGHSFGGAAAIASLTKKDNHFAGGINMDGWQYGVHSAITKPALFFGRADRTGDPTWSDMWPFLKGWKKEIRLSKSMHNTFGGDLALLFKLRGVPVIDNTVKATGTLDGKRSFEVVTTYVQAFMDRVLKGKKRGLLDGPSDAYPEVSFQEH
jgi:dienelactone hydrolase